MKIKLENVGRNIGFQTLCLYESELFYAITHTRSIIIQHKIIKYTSLDELYPVGTVS